LGKVQQRRDCNDVVERIELWSDSREIHSVRAEISSANGCGRALPILIG